MKTLKKSLLTGGLMLLATASAYAGHNDGKGDIRDRLDRQHARIEQGIESGKLTRKEAKVLKREQRKTRHLYHEFKEDGYLSKRERRELHRRLGRVSDQIWDLKHNERSRYDMRGYRYGYDWDDVGERSRYHHHDQKWYW
jgi:hypothetical protein